MPNSKEVRNKNSKKYYNGDVKSLSNFCASVFAILRAFSSQLFSTMMRSTGSVPE